MELMTDQINKLHSILEEINQINMRNMNNIDMRLRYLEDKERQQKEDKKQIALFLDGISDYLKKNDNNIY